MTVRREFIKGADDERRKGIKTATLPPTCTGLPFAISVSRKRTVVLDARVKVYEGPNPVGSPVAVVAIGRTPHVVEGKLSCSDLTLLRKWVVLNWDVLILLRDRELRDEKEALASFHPIRLPHGSLDDYVDPLFDYWEHAGYWFTDLQKNRTGLPFVVWVSVSGGVDHDVRIWTAPDYTSDLAKMTCLAIRPTVRVLKGKILESDLDLLRRWVDLNMEMILKVWEGEIDSMEAIDTTRSI